MSRRATIPALVAPPPPVARRTLLPGEVALDRAAIAAALAKAVLP